MTTSETKPPRIPPTSVVKRALAVRSRLRRMADAMIPPQGITAERTFLIAEIKMLGVICELRIPEAIDEGATTAERDRRACRSSGGRHRAGAALRCFAWLVRPANATAATVLNARSRALRAEDPQSLRDWVLFMAADWHWDIWNRAIDAVRDGGSPATRRAGQTVLRLGTRGPSRRRAARSTARCGRCRRSPARWSSRRSSSTGSRASATSVEGLDGCCAPCSTPRRRHGARSSISPTSSPARRTSSAICRPTDGARSAAASSSPERSPAATTAT